MKHVMLVVVLAAVLGLTAVAEAQFAGKVDHYLCYRIEAWSGSKLPQVIGIPLSAAVLADESSPLFRRAHIFLFAQTIPTVEHRCRSVVIMHQQEQCMIHNGC